MSNNNYMKNICLGNHVFKEKSRVINSYVNEKYGL